MDFRGACSMMEDRQEDVKNQRYKAHDYVPSAFQGF